jgi:diadenosine tetraphosphate (Ap4A) HIT family hydrolase
MSSKGAEHVYAAVIGHGIPHFHLHLIARYPGTPEEYWWTRLDEWPDAPRGDAVAIIALADRLRAAIGAVDEPRHRGSGVDRPGRVTH